MCHLSDDRAMGADTDPELPFWKNKKRRDREQRELAEVIGPPSPPREIPERQTGADGQEELQLT